MGEGRHYNPGWLLSALSLRPPWGAPGPQWGCGRREPEGSGLAARRRFPEGRGRPRGCRTGPWPGRRAWRAGWVASSWCQVRSAGRGPGRAGWQAWELGGGAMGTPKGTVCGAQHREGNPSPRPGGCTPAAMRCLWLDPGWTPPLPPQPAAGSRLSRR